MADEISAEEVEALDTAFAELPAYATKLAVRETERWRLFAGLLRAAEREFESLKLGLANSSAMTAWACGNLLELHIYTRYVLSSADHAARVVLESLGDGIETLDSFQTWLARNDPALVPEEIVEAIRRFSELQAKTEGEELPPLKLKRMAAEVGLADEHANMTRLEEKLAHPGPYSILDGGELDRLRPALFRAGAGHGLEILRAIQERFG